VALLARLIGRNSQTVCGREKTKTSLHTEFDELFDKNKSGLPTFYNFPVIHYYVIAVSTRRRHSEFTHAQNLRHKMGKVLSFPAMSELLMQLWFVSYDQ